MTFTARLRKSSHIYATWRGARRIQGVVGKAVFRLAPGMEYVTGTLTPDELESLRLNPCVQVEMVGSMPEIVGDVLTYERDDPGMPIQGVRSGDLANPAAMVGGETEKPKPKPVNPHPNRFTRENNPRRKRTQG